MWLLHTQSDSSTVRAGEGASDTLDRQEGGRECEAAPYVHCKGQHRGVPCCKSVASCRRRTQDAVRSTAQHHMLVHGDLTCKKRPSVDEEQSQRGRGVTRTHAGSRSNLWHQVHGGAGGGFSTLQPGPPPDALPPRRSGTHQTMAAATHGTQCSAPTAPVGNGARCQD